MSSGCVPKHIRPQSEVLRAEDFGLKKTNGKFSRTIWPTLDWWKVFGDKQLNLLVQEGIANSSDLRAAEARIRQANAIAGSVESELWPSLNGTAEFSRSRTSLYGRGNGAWSKLYDAKISSYFELDIWGKNRAALKAAIGRLKSKEIERYATQLSLAHSIVQAYINLDQLYSELAIQQEMLETYKSLLELTRQRYFADLDSLVSVKQALAAIPATRAEIASLRESLELTRNQFVMLVGKGPDRGLQIEEPSINYADITMVPDNLPAELLGHRPDIVANRWMVEAKSYDVRVSKAEYYPNINLSSFIGVQSLGFSNLHKRNSYEFSVGPAFSLPIFDAGRLDSNLADAISSYDLAVENYNAGLTGALQDLADQLTSLKWLKERLKEQGEALKTSQESADLALAQYGAGLVSYLQVISTQSVVFSQKLLLSQLTSRGLSLYAQLNRALGGGYSPDNLPLVSDISSNLLEPRNER
nr:efflux transporter outer membrane subunit [Pseudomonas aeruginosa]